MIWGRHHSTHKQPWKHDNPHDHQGGKDKNGNNTLVGGPQKPNDKFQPPEQCSQANINCSKALDDIAIVSYDDRENEEENGLYLDIRYSVYKGESANSYRMGVKL